MGVEWTREAANALLRQTNNGDRVEIRDSAGSVAFGFDPASGAGFFKEVNAQAQINARADVNLIHSFLENAGKITFESADTPRTDRTCMFEKDGDFYLAVNAEYSSGQWNRKDPNKCAYLLVVWSKHGIDGGTPPPAGSAPTGPVWYRCVAGSNPIGGWQAVGGWETGLFMDEYRNLVLGGINLEVDGSSAPAHGRLTHCNDAYAPVTIIQRNSWYNAGDSWARDDGNAASAAWGINADGNLFYWFRAAGGSATWNTAGWAARATIDHDGNLWVKGNVDMDGAFLGEYQTQSGAWGNPSGPTTNGRIVTVYNSTQGASRLYVYSNGAWRYVSLT